MMSMPATFTVELMVAFVFPPPSNVAMSEDPGAVVSFPPPEVVDQLLLLVKLPPGEPIQYFVAAKAGVAEQRSAKAKPDESNQRGVIGRGAQTERPTLGESVHPNRPVQQLALRNHSRESSRESHAEVAMRADRWHLNTTFQSSFRRTSMHNPTASESISRAM